MNIGYLIDLNHLVPKDALDIPHVFGLHYQHLEVSELNIQGIRRFRDEVVMMDDYAGHQIGKHIFFFIVENTPETVSVLSGCLADMQKDIINFNQVQYEVHVVFNLVKEDGLTIGKYEEMMPCLKNNAVCIYTWIVDKYEYSGGRPVTDIRRSHAIVRLAWMVCQHRNELSLQQMSQTLSPIYNLFGDSCVFFNEEERNDAVRYYYYYKSLQHLLNLPDKNLEEYLKENVLPFRGKPELENRIDGSMAAFLLEQLTPIEATVITEKTQGLLIKSSDDDDEYLVNAVDNSLVFIDDLSRKQSWQLEGIAAFIKNYKDRVDIDEEHQDSISEEFIADLQERLSVHNRTVFDSVNNDISRNRRKQVDTFKDKVDGHLTRFLNSQGRDSYTKLSEILTPQDVKIRNSNIDKGLAFLEYLEAGRGDYLVDQEVAAGDTNLSKIKIAIDERESRLLQEFQAKEKDIEEKNKPGKDGDPSKIKRQFDVIDTEIGKQKEVIRLCNYQLEHWYDADKKVNKWTARLRSTIAFVAGFLASILWIFPYLKWIRPTLVSIFNHSKEAPNAFYRALSKMFVFIKGYDRIEWSIFAILLLLGVIIGLIILWRVVKKRKEAEMMLQKAKDRKKRLFIDCVEDVKNLVERHYKHMLAFHGKKTLAELVEYVKQKEVDLVSFRKTIFRLMLKYRLAIPETAHRLVADQNTVEINDIDVKQLLFGPEENGRQIPFCFAGGITLSDTFEFFKRKKVRLETTRFNPDFSPQEDFDPVAIENEVIPAKKEDMNSGIQYTQLKRDSILPKNEGVEMDDIHQGQCGDCYFMATLAAIAQMNPEYIIGKNGMIQELGEEHRFFRVKFYDKDGNRICVDVDNKFWNKNDHPIYAKEGKSDSDETSYDPWVMAVEKAWAKANNEGYDGIEGASADGKERIRKVEYSFAVTGKSAFYCMTQNVPNRDRLQEMMKKHILSDHLPITLYSAPPADSSFGNRDPYIVENHAYALKSVNADGTFDIFNPWNSHSADEDVRGKHFEHVDINFIKDNFDVIVFFGIREQDFSYFERNLTDNASENAVEKEIEKVLSSKFDKIDLPFHKMEELMTDDIMERTFINGSYLFNKTRIKDERGVNKDGHHVLCLEPARDCEKANDKLREYLKSRGQFSVQVVSVRPDSKKNMTILRLSPGFVLASFNDA